MSTLIRPSEQLNVRDNAAEIMSSSKIKLHPVSSDTLMQLTGLVALGGDALADSEALYTFDEQRESDKTQFQKLTAIIEPEGDGFVALCPELDVASQGDTVEAARHNLAEAISLLLEVAPPEEIKQRLR